MADTSWIYLIVENNTTETILEIAPIIEPTNHLYLYSTSDPNVINNIANNVAAQLMVGGDNNKGFKRTGGFFIQPSSIDTANHRITEDDLYRITEDGSFRIVD